jgi:hypothetical protein
MIRTARKIRWRSGAISALIATAAAGPLTLAGAQAADASWAAQTPPSPPHAIQAGLDSVSCISASACMATASAQTLTRSEAFTESWNGASWALETIPDAAHVILFGVSCTSPTGCMAVGRVSTGSSLAPLAEYWNGTSWAAQNPPLPAGVTEGTLTGVSCTGPARCVAVGYSAYSGAPDASPFSESWNGTTWTPHAAPAPAPGTTEFLAVSCLAARSCTAVGESQTSSGFGPLAESWDGQHWTAQNVPSPGGDTVSSLQGVSCRSATGCTAVGNAGTGATSQTLAEQWNGGAWTIVSTPHVAGARTEASLLSVSCPRAVWCTASGDVIQYGKTRLVAERWNGTRWAVDATVTLPHTHFSALSGVSCPVKGSCIAVGSRMGRKAHQRPLAEQDS